MGASHAHLRSGRCCCASVFTVGAEDVGHRERHDNGALSCACVTPGSVLDTVMSITGLAGHDHYFLGSIATPWDAWPQWDVLMVLALLPAVLVGAFVLARRPLLPAMVVGGLFAGTLIVGILVSLTPGFAERTVLSSVAGWCLLLSAAAALVGRSAIPLRAVAAFSVLFVILGRSSR